MDKNKSKLPAPRVYKSEQEARAGLLAEHPDCSLKVVAEMTALNARALARREPGARELAVVVPGMFGCKILAAFPIPEFAGMDPDRVRELRRLMGC